MGKFDVDIRSGKLSSVDPSSSSDLSVELPKAKALEAALEIKTQDRSAEIDRLQQRLVSEADTTPQFQATYSTKVNFLQAQIRSMRSVLEIQKDMQGPSWQQLEGELAKVEHFLVDALEKPAKHSADVMALSKNIDDLHSHLAKVESLTALPKDSDIRSNKTFDANAILSELGVDSSGMKTSDDLRELQLSMAIERETIADRMAVGSQDLSEKKSELQSKIDQLAKRTESQSYGLLDVFSDKYESENAADRDLVEQIQEASDLVANAEHAQAELSNRATLLDTALSAFQAEASWSAGRQLQAQRHMVRLLETPLASMLEQSAETELSSVRAGIADSREQLLNQGQLSERETLLYCQGSSDSSVGRAIRSALDNRESLDAQSARHIDILDQVKAREIYSITVQKKGTEFFQEVPTYEGREQKHLKNYHYTFLSIRGSDHDGSGYKLLFDAAGRKAWGSTPRGAVPVLLKKVSTMKLNVKSRRGVVSSRLENPPSDFIVGKGDVGYVQDGKVYSSDGVVVDVEKTGIADWIKKQTVSSRSFSTAKYNPRITLKQYEVGSRRLIDFKEQLYTIKTESGQDINGVRLSEDVRQLLSEPPPKGMTLVLKRTPESLSYTSRIQAKTSSSARRKSFFHKVISVDELTLEDFAYAKKDQGKLVVRDIAFTKRSTATTKHASVQVTKQRDAASFFEKAPTFDDRKQSHLLHLSHTTIKISGGAHRDTSMELLFTDRAKSAWKQAPEGARPIILKDAKKMNYTRKNRRHGGLQEFILHNPPSDYFVDDYHIGYELKGKVYSHQGVEIQIEGHEGEAFIRRQLGHSREFSVSSYQSDGKVLRYNAQKNSSEVVIDELHNLTLHSGREVRGVRVSPEVQELLSESRELGRGIVLKRIPASIELSGRHSSPEHGNVWCRTLQAEPDELRLEDIALAETNRGVIQIAELASADDRLLAASHESDQLAVEQAEKEELKAKNSVMKASISTQLAVPDYEDEEFDIAELEKADVESARDLLRILSTDKDLSYSRSAAVSTLNSLSNLQQLLGAAQKGSSREEYVEFVREEAQMLHEMLDSDEMKQSVKTLQVRIGQLKKMQRRVANGDLEEQIAEQIDAMEQFVEVVTSDSTRNLVETLRDPSKFGPDSWAHFTKHRLPVIIGSVAVAVAATAVVVATWGAAFGAAAPLYAMAAAGAIGGLVGSELSQELLYQYHNRDGSGVLNGDYVYNSRSLILTKEEFNHETGKYEKVSWGTVGANYSRELTISFASSYATMGLSNVLGNSFSQALTNSRVLERIATKSEAARAVMRYMARRGAGGNKEFTKGQVAAAFKESFKDIHAEFLDELSDEALEGVLGKAFQNTADNLFGVKNDFYQENIAAVIIGSLKGTRVGTASFDYDASTVTDENSIEQMLDQARERGYLVTDLGRGYYTLHDTTRGVKFSIQPAEVTSLQRIRENVARATGIGNAETQLDGLVLPRLAGQLGLNDDWAQRLAEELSGGGEEPEEEKKLKITSEEISSLREFSSEVQSLRERIENTAEQDRTKEFNESVVVEIQGLYEQISSSQSSFDMRLAQLQQLVGVENLISSDKRQAGEVLRTLLTEFTSDSGEAADFERLSSHFVTMVQISRLVEANVEVDFAKEIEAASGALLDLAEKSLSSQGVAYERVLNNGKLRALKITQQRRVSFVEEQNVEGKVVKRKVIDPTVSKFNDYAARLKKSRGVDLLYDPQTLVEQRAGALFQRNSRGASENAEQSKKIFLSHDSIASGSPTKQVYHEKIHATLDRIREQGGDSMLFGRANLGNRSFSLDEYATYAELLNSHGAELERLMSQPNVSADELRSAFREVSEHLNFISSANQELSQLLHPRVLQTFANQVQLSTESRLDKNGETVYYRVGSISISDMSLTFDLGSSKSESLLPNDSAALETLSKRLQSWQQLTTKVGQELGGMIEASRRFVESPTQREAVKDLASRAQNFRNAINDQYLESKKPLSTIVKAATQSSTPSPLLDLDALIVPTTEARESSFSPTFDMSATHESGEESSNKSPNSDRLKVARQNLELELDTIELDVELASDQAEAEEVINRRKGNILSAVRFSLLSMGVEFEEIMPDSPEGSGPIWPEFRISTDSANAELNILAKRLMKKRGIELVIKPRELVEPGNSASLDLETKTFSLSKDVLFQDKLTGVVPGEAYDAIGLEELKVLGFGSPLFATIRIEDINNTAQLSLNDFLTKTKSVLEGVSSGNDLRSHEAIIALQRTARKFSQIYLEVIKDPSNSTLRRDGEGQRYLASVDTRYGRVEVDLGDTDRISSLISNSLGSEFHSDEQLEQFASSLMLARLTQLDDISSIVLKHCNELTSEFIQGEFVGMDRERLVQLASAFRQSILSKTSSSIEEALALESRVKDVVKVAAEKPAISESEQRLKDSQNTFGYAIDDARIAAMLADSYFDKVDLIEAQKTSIVEATRSRLDALGVVYEERLPEKTKNDQKDGGPWPEFWIDTNSSDSQLNLDSSRVFKKRGLNAVFKPFKLLLEGHSAAIDWKNRIEEISEDAVYYGRFLEILEGHEYDHAVFSHLEEQGFESPFLGSFTDLNANTVGYERAFTFEEFPAFSKTFLESFKNGEPERALYGIHHLQLMAAKLTELNRSNLSEQGSASFTFSQRARAVTPGNNVVVEINNSESKVEIILGDQDRIAELAKKTLGVSEVDSSQLEAFYQTLAIARVTQLSQIAVNAQKILGEIKSEIEQRDDSSKDDLIRVASQFRSSLLNVAHTSLEHSLEIEEGARRKDSNFSATHESQSEETYQSLSSRIQNIKNTSADFGSASSATEMVDAYEKATEKIRELSHQLESDIIDAEEADIFNSKQTDTLLDSTSEVAEEQRLSLAHSLREVIDTRHQEFTQVFDTGRGSRYYVDSDGSALRIRRERRRAGQPLVSQTDKVFFLTPEKARELSSQAGWDSLDAANSIDIKTQPIAVGLQPIEILKFSVEELGDSRIRILPIDDKAKFHAGSPVTAIIRDTTNEDFSASHESDSSLLDRAIDRSENARLQVAADRPDEELESTIFEVNEGLDPFSVEVSDAGIMLRYQGSEKTVELNDSLDQQEFGFFEDYLRKFPDNFGPRMSSQKELLSRGVEYARLHSAFLSDQPSPRKAANVLVELLKREKYHAKTFEVSEGNTSKNRHEGFGILADVGTEISKRLESRFQGEQINEAEASRLNDYARKVRESLADESSAELLDEILSAHDRGSLGAEQAHSMLDEILREDSRRGDPVTLELSGPRLYNSEGFNSEASYSFELSPTGSLVIYRLKPRRGSEVEIDSVAALFNDLKDLTSLPETSRGSWSYHQPVENAEFSASHESDFSSRYELSSIVAPLRDFSVEIPEEEFTLENVLSLTQSLLSDLTSLSREVDVELDKLSASAQVEPEILARFQRQAREIPGRKVDTLAKAIESRLEREFSSVILELPQGMDSARAIFDLFDEQVGKLEASREQLLFAINVDPKSNDRASIGLAGSVEKVFRSQRSRLESELREQLDSRLNIFADVFDTKGGRRYYRDNLGETIHLSKAGKNQRQKVGLTRELSILDVKQLQNVREQYQIYSRFNANKAMPLATFELSQLTLGSRAVLGQNIQVKELEHGRVELVALRDPDSGKMLEASLQISDPIVRIIRVAGAAFDTSEFDTVIGDDLVNDQDFSASHEAEVRILSLDPVSETEFIDELGKTVTRSKGTHVYKYREYALKLDRKKIVSKEVAENEIRNAQRACQILESLDSVLAVQPIGIQEVLIEGGDSTWCVVYDDFTQMNNLFELSKQEDESGAIPDDIYQAAKRLQFAALDQLKALGVEFSDQRRSPDEWKFIGDPREAGAKVLVFDYGRPGTDYYYTNSSDFSASHESRRNSGFGSSLRRFANRRLRGISDVPSDRPLLTVTEEGLAVDDKVIVENPLLAKALRDRGCTHLVGVELLKQRNIEQLKALDPTDEVEFEAVITEMGITEHAQLDLSEIDSSIVELADEFLKRVKNGMEFPAVLEMLRPVFISLINYAPEEERGELIYRLQDTVLKLDMLNPDAAWKTFQHFSELNQVFSKVIAATGSKEVVSSLYGPEGDSFIFDNLLAHEVFSTVINEVYSELNSLDRLDSFSVVLNAALGDLPRAYERMSSFDIDRLNKSDRKERIEQELENARVSLEKAPVYSTLRSLLRSGEVQFDGKTYPINGIRFLKSDGQSDQQTEARGQNIAYVIETTNSLGEAKSLILKQSSDENIENDVVGTSFCRHLKLPSYLTMPAQFDQENNQGTWQLIEQRKSTLIAATVSLGRFSTFGLERFLSAEDSLVEKRLVGLGKIFAVEYLLQAKDSKCKHILVDEESGLPFRIDWEGLVEYSIGGSEDFPTVLAGDTRKLLSKIAESEGGSEMIEHIITGFNETLDLARADLTDAESSELVDIIEREVSDSDRRVQAVSGLHQKISNTNKEIADELRLSEFTALD